MAYRMMIGLMIGLGLGAAIAPARAAEPLKYILDMVHHNPGEPQYDSQFNDPRFVADCGYTGKVYFLFESPTLAVNWDSVDPDINPPGSKERQWMQAHARDIHAKLDACKQAGLDVYAQADMVLLPRKLVEKYDMGKTFGNPRDPKTQEFVNQLIDLTFEQFPKLDGLVVRIGETYLHDAPMHVGHIRSKNDTDKTVVPLIRLLREAICERHDKTLIFRTWVSFGQEDQFMRVSEAIEPHDQLGFSRKFCDGDFHRDTPFAAMLGKGRHPQIVEVQCAREYEGKGAYPNYIANGVIEGFEDYDDHDGFKSLRGLHEQTDVFSGVWTWSRGGGWGGPYPGNEFWCELNARVMCNWANDPARSEEDIFMDYATDTLGLSEGDARSLRELALLSAKAVYRGQYTTGEQDVYIWWTRDDKISTPGERMPPEEVRDEVLTDRRTAVQMWRRIVELADRIDFPDDETEEFVQVSSRYGLHLFRIYCAAFHACYLDAADADRDEILAWCREHERAWADYAQLREDHPEVCPTLYHRYARGHKRMTAAASDVERIMRRARIVPGAQPTKIISTGGDELKSGTTVTLHASGEDVTWYYRSGKDRDVRIGHGGKVEFEVPQMRDERSGTILIAAGKGGEVTREVTIYRE